jgi:tRNA dimethylallyltransferase
LEKKNSKTVIVLAGPTAVGKTAAAINLARHFSTAIISADSRQCYRELSIGVARPSVEELEAVPHYFIASHSIHEEVNAAAFESFALEKTAELFKKHDVVVMTGGTGLYIRAFTDGLDEIPAAKTGTRNQIIKQYEEKGLPWLQEEIRLKDPLFFDSGEMQNPQRMMRALEVMEDTGRSVFSFRTRDIAERDFNMLKIGLELPRDILRERIAVRVHQMIEKGLIDEVRSLLPYRHLNALQTVGYAEIFDYLDGKISLENATQQIIDHTRQYAKRQMTWFRREKDITWFDPGQLSAVISFCEKYTNHIDT